MRRRAIAMLFASCALAAPLQARADITPDQGETEALYQEALLALAEGRRTDASLMLRQVIDKEPRHAGAWLDLAMTQCGLGNGQEAERLFDTVETRFNPSPEMLELIAEMREEGCKPWKPSSSLAISFGRGSDQNVNQGASTSTLHLEGTTTDLPLQDQFLPKRDDYLVGSLDYLRDLTPNGTIGFAQLQWRRNDSLHQYDSSALFGGVESPYRLGNWGVRATAIAGAVSLGGQVYQRQAQAQARVAPPVSLPHNASFDVMGGFTYNDYRSLTHFDSRTFELRPEFVYHSGDLFGSASLGFLDDRGEAERPGGDRHGQLLNLLVRQALGWNTSGELAYTRQTWRSAHGYAPDLLIPQIRDQATEVLRASLTYRFDPHHSLLLEARGVRNRENISIFQYNNRQLQLSWRWQP
jgi:hypothetical protein